MINGAKVLRLRSKGKQTQRDVSIKTGLTIQTISGIENGHKSNITTDNLISLAKALDVEPAELLK